MIFFLPFSVSFQTFNCFISDIDECDTSWGNLCPSSLTCLNVPGSFECTCDGSLVLAHDGTTCISKLPVKGQ